MPATTNAAASPLDLEALADSLSACADILHTRLMRAIRRSPHAPEAGATPAPASGSASAGSIDQGLSQGAAQALFENEVALRQRANGLYLEAAELAGLGLGGQQQILLDLAVQAQDRIRRINRIKDMVSLLADLLSLGAAVAAGKPEHLGPPVEKLRRHLADLQAGAPPSVAP
jgi:hypothetical protein